MKNPSSGESGRISRQALTALIVLLIIGAFFVYRTIRRVPRPGPGPTVGVPRGGFPEMRDKPTPKQVVFKGCPPEGDGGDPALNRLKNRVDEARSSCNPQQNEMR